jgi:hypothetical protein
MTKTFLGLAVALVLGLWPIAALAGSTVVTCNAVNDLAKTGAPSGASITLTTSGKECYFSIDGASTKLTIEDVARPSWGAGTPGFDASQAFRRFARILSVSLDRSLRASSAASFSDRRFRTGLSRTTSTGSFRLRTTRGRHLLWTPSDSACNASQERAMIGVCYNSARCPATSKASALEAN